jgi:hypothetical protein
VLLSGLQQGASQPDEPPAELDADDGPTGDDRAQDRDRESQALSRLEAQRKELEALPTEALKDELLRALRWTSEGLVRIALIVRTLEERDEDLSNLKVTLLPYLRQIAHGQVLPDVVVRFGESPLLVRHISALPLPDQDRLARGELIPMAVKRPDGSVTHLLADPLSLRREQVAMVFARDRIRPLEEQVVLLEGKPIPRRRRDVGPPSNARVKPDRERGGIVVGRTFIPAAEAVAALAALNREWAGEDEDEPPDGERKQVNVVLTEPQHERIRKAAYDGRTKIATLVRRALAAYGLI